MAGRGDIPPGCIRVCWPLQPCRPGTALPRTAAVGRPGLDRRAGPVRIADAHLATSECGAHPSRAGHADHPLYTLLHVSSLLLLRPKRVACAVVLALGASMPARAQSLPSEPLVFGGGRLTISGDVTATVSCSAGT